MKPKSVPTVIPWERFAGWVGDIFGVTPGKNIIFSSYVGQDIDIQEIGELECRSDQELQRERGTTRFKPEHLPMIVESVFFAVYAAPPPPRQLEEGQPEDFNASMAANRMVRCTCCGNTYNLFTAGQPHHHECPPSPPPREQTGNHARPGGQAMSGTFWDSDELLGSFPGMAQAMAAPDDVYDLGNNGGPTDTTATVVFDSNPAPNDDPTGEFLLRS